MPTKAPRALRNRVLIGVRFFPDLLILCYIQYRARKPVSMRFGDERAVHVMPHPPHLGAQSCGLKHVSPPVKETVPC